MESISITQRASSTWLATVVLWWLWMLAQDTSEWPLAGVPEMVQAGVEARFRVHGLRGGDGGGAHGQGQH
jgi:hypothetical protein